MHWYTPLWSTNLCTNVFICHFVIFVIFVAKGVEGNAYLLEF